MKKHEFDCELICEDGTKIPVTVSMVWTADTRNAVRIIEKKSGKLLSDKKNLETPMPVMKELQGWKKLDSDSARWLYNEMEPMMY